jgi:hypothetical protein
VVPAVDVAPGEVDCVVVGLVVFNVPDALPVPVPLTEPEVVPEVVPLVVGWLPIDVPLCVPEVVPAPLVDEVPEGEVEEPICPRLDVDEEPGCVAVELCEPFCIVPDEVLLVPAEEVVLEGWLCGVVD